MKSRDALRPEQNGCNFAEDISKRIILNEDGLILISISLRICPKSQIDNQLASV